MFNPLLADADAPLASHGPEPAASGGSAGPAQPSPAPAQGQPAEGQASRRSRGPLTANQLALVAACKAHADLDRAARLCKAHGLEFVAFYPADNTVECGPGHAGEAEGHGASG